MKKFFLPIIFLLISIYFMHNTFGAAKNNKIKVACIGDSITFGYGVENRHLNSYPAYLQRLLGDKYEVKNFGNSGRGIILSSRRGNESRAFMHTKEQEEALKFNPDIVICNLGINDVDAIMGGKRDEFTSDYLTLIKTYQNLPSKPQIFIWNKLCYLTSKHRYMQGNLAGAKYTMQIREDLNRICKKANVIGIDGFSPIQGHPEYMPDGIHPNADGMRLLAISIYEQILPYINQTPHLNMPYYFSNNMVLPLGDAPIFGITTPSTKVSASFGKIKSSTTSDEYGRFKMLLKTTMGAKGTLNISTNKARSSYKNVVVGKLFLALGQSNMEFTIAQANEKDSAVQDASLNRRADVRVLNRVRTNLTTQACWKENEYKTPWQANQILKGNWIAPKGKNILSLSAISYYFAREMQMIEQCPIGVICIAVGGTTTESFLSESALLSDLQLSNMVTNTLWYDCALAPAWVRKRAKENLASFYKQKHITQTHPVHYFQPSVLFNAGIQPLSSLNFEGILFYQGESNAPDQYDISEKESLSLNEKMLKTLITDLRKTFHQESLPFYLVQLPNMNRNWMEYRLMQDKVCEEVPNCHLCCILDLGHNTDVHPKEKYKVGLRLANLAKTPAISSPQFKSYQLNAQELMIEIECKNGSLKTTDDKKVRGFEIAGADGKFLLVDGEIMGHFIILQIPGEIKNPKFVRYAYAQNPKINTVDDLNLPLKPFTFKIVE